MVRFRKRRSSGGGGGMNKRAIPFIGLILGGIALFVTMIAFGITLTQWDSSYTTAATYTEQVGVTDIMGIMPLLLFVLFQAVGIGALVGTGVLNYKTAANGGFIEIFLAIVYAAIGVVVAVIIWNLNQGQLHTVYNAANATNLTNSASFTGLQDIITAWGIVDLIAIMSPALGAIAGIGVGGYRKARQII